MKALEISGLGKSYRSYSSEWARVFSWFGQAAKSVDENWVLRNIDFTVSPGSAVGIIGQNGAGKSTLLKLIVGTLRPTEGSVKTSGRIAAILELGMGFNPELTGRQNVIHAAGLMGFDSLQVQKLMPDIEAFAEIGDYFDEPVRTYSSGMQMRVAFSIATANRPDTLIVDEALSVGDTYFQHKSFKRIREFQDQGTTLLIVSHDRQAIQSICDRAILMENGSILKDGHPEEVFDFYNAIIAEKEKSTVNVELLESGKSQTTSGTSEAAVVEVALYNSQGEVVECIGVGEKVELRIKVKVYLPIEDLVLGYEIKDRLGQVMYGTNTWYTDQIIHGLTAGDEYLFSINFVANLGIGSYSIATALHNRETHLTANYDWRDLALVFKVVNAGNKQFNGCNWIQPEISVGIL